MLRAPKNQNPHINPNPNPTLPQPTQVSAGHDGTWVAHPALVKIARDIFDKHMSSPNQISLVPVEGGEVTEEQVR